MLAGFFKTSIFHCQFVVKITIFLFTKFQYEEASAKICWQRAGSYSLVLREATVS